jgi:hypothetical protein
VGIADEEIFHYKGEGGVVEEEHGCGSFREAVLRERRVTRLSWDKSPD